MADGKGIRSPGRDIYSTNFADYLPETLKRDPKMKALAAAVTEQMLGVSAEIDNVLIYSRIDELPEELIDILAFDMHVDWYDYSYPLAAKRDILKNSVKVHKKMGTKYAIEKGLSGLYPISEVEEWFEYEGQPHHFHIVCDVSSNRITASYREIVNAVKMYKRLSSWLDEIVYQSRIYCTIMTHTDCFIYKNPLTNRLLAGTYPQRNRRGAQSGSCIVVGTEAAGFIFLPPLAGTVPERNIVFRHSDSRIDVKTALKANRYRNIPAGQKNAGEVPQRSHKGAAVETGVVVEDGAAGFPFSVPEAGTVPERNVVFRYSATQIDAETALNALGYRNIPAGKKNAGETPQRSHKGAAVETVIAAEAEKESFPYSVPEAGTVPERNRRGKTRGETVTVEEAAEDFMFSMPQAGTVPERNTILCHSATQIDAETALNALGYRNIPAGKKNVGETPQRNAEGQQAGGGTIGGEVQTAVFQHKTTLCGNKRKL